MELTNAVTQRFVNCHNKLKKDQVVRSSRQFAQSLDYLPQSLSEILNHRRDVTVELLRKAIEVYKFNPVYLFTGQGPWFLQEEEHNKDLRVLTIVTDDKNDERIVHVPMPAQAGYAGHADKPTFMRELPTFTLPDYKYKVGTHRSFDVAGDSMEPTLFEGDKVVCSYLEPALWESSIKDHYVYVVVTMGDILVKRVRNRIKEDKTLLLLSDNTYYEAQAVKIMDIREIWYVRAKISPFLPSPQSLDHSLRNEVNQLQQIIRQQSVLIETLNKTVQELLHRK